MIKALILVPLSLVVNVYALLYLIALVLITVFLGANLWEGYPYETWMAIGVLILLSKSSKFLVRIRAKQINSVKGDGSFSELTLVAVQYTSLWAATFVIGTGVLRLLYYYFIPSLLVMTGVIVIAFIFDYFKPFFVR